MFKWKDILILCWLIFNFMSDRGHGQPNPILQKKEAGVRDSAFSHTPHAHGSLCTCGSHPHSEAGWTGPQ